MDFQNLQSEIKALIGQEKFDEALAIIDSQLSHSKDQITAIPDATYIDIWRERWQLQLLKCEIFNIQWQYDEALVLTDEILKESQLMGQLTPDIQLKTTTAKAFASIQLRDIKGTLKLVKSAEKLLDVEYDSKEIDCERIVAILQLIMAMVSFNFSQYEEAIKSFKESLTVLRQKGSDDWLAGYGQVVEGAAYCDSGKFSDGLEFLKASAAYNETKGFSFNLCMNLGVIANYYGEKGEWALAEKYGSEAMLIAGQKAKKTILQAYIQAYLGRIYVARGELNKAEPLLLESVKICKSLETPFVFAPANALGELYRIKGNLDRAIAYLTTGLQATKEMGYKNGECWVLDSLGAVYRDKGEFPKAIDYLKKGLAERKALGNQSDIARTLFNLLLVALETNNLPEAKLQLKDLEHLDRQVTIPVVTHRTALASALVLKHSHKIIDKAHAQEKLTDLTTKEDIEATILILALLNLFDLLLLEWKVSESDETLQEIHALLDRIKAIANSQEMISLIIETNLLQGAVALIEGQIKQTDSLLAEATELAENHNLNYVITKIQRLQNQITSQIKEWQTILKQNASIAQRIEKADLEDYLDGARKLALSFD